MNKHSWLVSFYYTAANGEDQGYAQRILRTQRRSLDLAKVRADIMGTNEFKAVVFIGASYLGKLK